MWTEQHGNQYRRVYEELSFEKKQRIVDIILGGHLQIVERPRFLMKCLTEITPTPRRIVELGGYDGTHALEVLDFYPGMEWVNYDISHVAAERTRPELKGYNYKTVVLNHPFPEYDLGSLDVFYTSKTLEHMKLEEIHRTINVAKRAKSQIHVIDWFWKDDMHVVEPNQHGNIVAHLEKLGYETRIAVLDNDEQSRIFCMRC